MIGIVEFITARLDEDEAAVAAPESWSAADESHGVRRVDVDLSSECVAASTRSWRAEHIARHDPARVLAEVKAKRAIVARHTTGAYRTYQCNNGDHIQEWQCERAGEPFEESRYCEVCGNECVELPLLATVCADHPDYDPAWRVE